MNKIGLALSGGGIKAFSQVPILTALVKEHIQIDAVSGTSMGAVIASLCASGASPDVIERVALDLEKEIAEKKIMSRPSAKILPFSKEKLSGGFIDGADLEAVLRPYLLELGIDHIRDAKIPVAISSVDVLTGKIIMFISHPDQFVNTNPDTIVISDISMAQAVRASCSFPFVIAAMPFQKYMLVDGGLRANLPLDVLFDYGCTKTIGVTMHSEFNHDNLDNLMVLGTRVLDIMRVESDKEVMKRADVIINVPLDTVQIFEVGKGKMTMNAGYRVVREHIDELRALRPVPTLWERIVKKK